MNSERDIESIKKNNKIQLIDFFSLYQVLKRVKNKFVKSLWYKKLIFGAESVWKYHCRYFNAKSVQKYHFN